MQNYTDKRVIKVKSVILQVTKGITTIIIMSSECFQKKKFQSMDNALILAPQTLITGVSSVYLMVLQAETASFALHRLRAASSEICGSTSEYCHMSLLMLTCSHTLFKSLKVKRRRLCFLHKSLAEVSSFFIDFL